MEKQAMTTAQAVTECERWFDYLDKQEQRSVKLKEAAKLAKAGEREAARKIQTEANLSLTVYDASRLRVAVKHLVNEVQN